MTTTETKVDPNFMIIGMQKCGTSWLRSVLRQHPDIYMTEKKELHFFNRRHNYEKGMDWYHEHFAAHQGEKAIGEATANYLWNCPSEREIAEEGVIPNIAPLIHSYYPDLKIIVCLREPVSRAVSAYFHFVRSLRVKPGESILKAGKTNGIITMGFYRRYIEEWLAYYPRENFLFLVYENDITRNKPQTLARTLRFLEVDDSFEPQELDRRVNTRNGHLQMRLKHISPRASSYFFSLFPFLAGVNFPAIKLDKQELEQLQQLYAVENEGLDNLIDQKLPW